MEGAFFLGRAPVGMLPGSLEKERQIGPLQRDNFRKAFEAGHYADIVAVEGNPLNDVRLLENVAFVMKGGTVYRQ